MKVLASFLVVVLLAGCTSSGRDDATDEDPRVSKASSEPAPPKAVVLLSEGLSLTPGGTKTWPVQVPANATDVHFTIVYPENFFHLGLHLSLDGCGQQDFPGPGGSIGNGAGSWEYPVCDAAEPGLQEFTVTLDRGIVDGQVKLVAYVPQP